MACSVVCCDHDQFIRISRPSTRNSHNQRHIETICDAGWAHQDPNPSHEQNVCPSRASGLHGVHLSFQHFLALGSCSFLCLLVAARLWLGILVHCCFAEQRRVIELEELRTRHAKYQHQYPTLHLKDSWQWKRSGCELASPHVAMEKVE